MAQKVQSVPGNEGAGSVPQSCEATPLGPLPPKFWGPQFSKIGTSGPPNFDPLESFSRAEIVEASGLNKRAKFHPGRCNHWRGTGPRICHFWPYRAWLD